MCRACGDKSPEGARFCGACGARLTTGTDAAEYKHVTVLFADVERSMDIAAAVDIERLREIMTELMERSTTVLRRYGGTVEYNGDGVMALFGAPVAFEDHAFRACLAAVEVQTEASRLAAAVRQRDGIEFRVRVGLNSGRVIAGEIGSGALGYRAIGETVGFAQRMESVAPAGGVMLSESTAHLVDGLVMMGEQQRVRVKGADQPVTVRRLVGIAPRSGRPGRVESTLVGRQTEMTAVRATLDSAIGGRGDVLNIVAPPGLGKSRVAREAAALAEARDAAVVWVFCESHARDISFGVVGRLLRAVTGEGSLDGDTTLEPQDLDDPDARRRRLTALITDAVLMGEQPTLVIIEDAQWIDGVSESMLTDILAVIDQSATLVLITARPEYDGALMIRPIQLAPLGDSAISALLRELLGTDPTLGDLATTIAERAAGNPFFAEEMVRELAQRGVLVGNRGDYRCRGDVSEITIPATVQAAIAARIDRLTPSARHTLNAASVIGERFSAELVVALGVEGDYTELLNTELIDQVEYTPAEYAFHHPLIRAVVYEAQLKSGRAEWHRRLAGAIERCAPDSVEENAALIAQHLQSAGEPRAAYDWHMRAGSWLTNRDIDAARVSWERAGRMADELAAEEPEQLSMRIAPRIMLSATFGWGPAVQDKQARFAELLELCSVAGDKSSLAIGMTGLATELLYAGRSREGSRLAAEQMALLESIGDPTSTVGLAFVAFNTWFDAGEFGELVRWTHTVVDLADGDPSTGAGFGLGSPLAAALALRGGARWWLGRPGWQQDLHDAVAMARDSDPETLAAVITWAYSHAITYGALRVDDSVARAIADAAQAAEGSNDVAVSIVHYTLGVGLLSSDATDDRRRGLELMSQARENFLRIGTPFLVPLAELCSAREEFRIGDRDAAIAVMRNAVGELQRAGRFGYGVWGTSVLAEALLERSAEGDLAEAQESMDWLEGLPGSEDWAIHAVTLLRLRALQARVRADPDYREVLGRYRALAEAHGYDGHVAWARAMEV